MGTPFQVFFEWGNINSRLKSTSDREFNVVLFGLIRTLLKSNLGLLSIFITLNYYVPLGFYILLYYMPSLWKARRKLRESKNMFNRVIDIIVTSVLGAIVLYIWIIFGTNLTSIGKNINSSSLPSNINQAPYCCKEKKSVGSWK